MTSNIKIKRIYSEISSIIIDSGIEFFEINGVKTQTIRGAKIVINIKFSIDIILDSQLIFQRLQSFHLQPMRHLNQNKY